MEPMPSFLFIGVRGDFNAVRAFIRAAWQPYSTLHAQRLANGTMSGVVHDDRPNVLNFTYRVATKQLRDSLARQLKRAGVEVAAQGHSLTLTGLEDVKIKETLRSRLVSALKRFSGPKFASALS